MGTWRHKFSNIPRLRISTFLLPVEHRAHGVSACHFGAILPLPTGSKISYKNVKLLLQRRGTALGAGVSGALPRGGFGISQQQQQLQGHKEAPGPAPGTASVPHLPHQCRAPALTGRGVRGRKTQKLQRVNKLN